MGILFLNWRLLALQLTGEMGTSSVRTLTVMGKLGTTGLTLVFSMMVYLIQSPSLDRSLCLSTFANMASLSWTMLRDMLVLERMLLLDALTLSPLP